MGRPQISIYTVLDVVTREMERSHKWDQISGTGMDKLKYTDFKIILITTEITTSERKVKELWVLIAELDLGKRINQANTYLIDFAKWTAFLGRKIEYYRVMAASSAEAMA